MFLSLSYPKKMIPNYLVQHKHISNNPATYNYNSYNNKTNTNTQSLQQQHTHNKHHGFRRNRTHNYPAWR